MDFRDIITFEQQPVLIIGNEEKIEYKDAKTGEKKSVLKGSLLNDPLYSPILTALKKGPLTVRELEKKYQGQGYSAFKKDLADTVKEFLTKFQKKFNNISDREVKTILEKGAERIRPMAEETLRKVKERLGVN